MTDEEREALRQREIRDQLSKAEEGFEQILDGSYLADLHVRNALSIAEDKEQMEKLHYILNKMRTVRLEMWAALGTANSNTFREV